MHQYELMVILDPTVEERTLAPSLDKFLNVIRNGGGTVDKVDIWGRRRFAYEIAKKTEGYYAVINLTAAPAEVLELDRQLKLSEAVLRTKVLRADEAVINITPVAVPEVSAAEKADDEAPSKPAAAKAPAAKAATAKAPAKAAKASE